MRYGFILLTMKPLLESLSLSLLNWQEKSEAVLEDLLILILEMELISISWSYLPNSALLENVLFK